MTIRYALMALVFCGSLVQAQQPATAPNDTPKVNQRPALAANSDSRRFVYTLDEFDHGRKLNTRTFELLCRERESSSLKAGSRLPIKGGTNGLQYIDVGLDVRAYYELRGDKRLDIRTEVEMSNVAPTENAPRSEDVAPVIRQTRSQLAATVSPETPTVLDTIEDLSSGHTYQLTLTVKDH